MKTKCSKCKHEWEYKGKSEYYVTCPCCHYNINTRKLKGGKQNENNRNRI